MALGHTGTGDVESGAGDGIVGSGAGDGAVGSGAGDGVGSLGSICGLVGFDREFLSSELR